MGDEVVWLTVGAIIFGCICILIGLWQDPVFRVKRLRQMTRKNYIMLGIVSPDNKSIKRLSVNADRDVITVDENIWVIESGKVWREDKPQAGFKFGKKIKWDEGVPSLFVYSDSLKPAEFDLGDKTHIKPDEAGASIMGFIANEMAKGFNTLKHTQLLQYLCLAGIIICIILAYFAMDNSYHAKVSAADADANTVIIAHHFNLVLPSDNITTTVNSTNSSNITTQTLPSTSGAV